MIRVFLRWLLRPDVARYLVMDLSTWLWCVLSDYAYDADRGV